MKMNDDFIEDNDLDWYASFSNGYLAHFTSGGTNAMPEKVKNSLESYEAIYDYFYDLKDRYEVEIIEENLPHFDNDAKRKQYLSSFTDAASKGLFSYNINFDDRSYFLVAKPVKPLSLSELPESISNELSKLPRDIQVGANCITKIE